MTTYRARDGIVVTGEDGTRFVTDLATGATYEVNETAHLVLAAARESLTLAEVADALAAAYPDVPRGEIERDAREILDEFVAAGLLVREG